MRYQLPDGMSSISAAGHSFEADLDGIIDVPADLGTAVHTALQDVRLWGLQAVDEVGTGVGLTAADEDAVVPVPPTEPPAPPREHKRHMIALLRSLGHIVDGRATFEFLRRKVMLALNDLDPASIAAAKAEAASVPANDPPAETPPVTEPTGKPTIDDIEAALKADKKVDIAPDGTVAITDKPPAETPTAVSEVADPLTAPLPPTDPAATPAA